MIATHCYSANYQLFIQLKYLNALKNFKFHYILSQRILFKYASVLI